MDERYQWLSNSPTGMRLPTKVRIMRKDSARSEATQFAHDRLHSLLSSMLIPIPDTFESIQSVGVPITMQSDGVNLDVDLQVYFLMAEKMALVRVVYRAWPVVEQQGHPVCNLTFSHTVIPRSWEILSDTTVCNFAWLGKQFPMSDFLGPTCPLSMVRRYLATAFKCTGDGTCLRQCLTVSSESTESSHVSSLHEQSSGTDRSEPESASSPPSLNEAESGNLDDHADSRTDPIVSLPYGPSSFLNAEDEISQATTITNSRALKVQLGDTDPSDVEAAVLIRGFPYEARTVNGRPRHTLHPDMGECTTSQKSGLSSKSSISKSTSAVTLVPKRKIERDLPGHDSVWGDSSSNWDLPAQSNIGTDNHPKSDRINGKPDIDSDIHAKGDQTNDKSDSKRDDQSEVHTKREYLDSVMRSLNKAPEYAIPWSTEWNSKAAHEWLSWVLEPPFLAGPEITCDATIDANVEGEFVSPSRFSEDIPVEQKQSISTGRSFSRSAPGIPVEENKATPSRRSSSASASSMEYELSLKEREEDRLHPWYCTLAECPRCGLAQSES
ncbi:hypothetical protein BU24DRAFT_464309 [Aaosphaeria arxii CBS 175.79]|uniref:Uncharacterized protein n=1 Tax=Aaosphaeria arxii CBS 175.79 TaxID=1450172 RepID=A0A6A5XMH6_9PLEO|nr:uncharacterized protein BU24DRAFT_464309 [Aaosphaeria arxii CBS 175.79]KAF2013534.1 hypothetical protein BU24DRAFT_464309 [Aaosphaeria arxii CBS 175.79]